MPPAVSMLTTRPGCRASPASAAASVLIAVDGCPHDCATKTLQLAGFTHVKSVRVTDLGFKKGKTPATDAAVQAVVQRVENLLLEQKTS
jgi:uncharacterized metal-binding protein